MGERDAGMRREEVADWLEEVAGQVRSGALTVDGESLPVPEEPAARLKSKSKDGRRRLKLELEWAEEPSGGKNKKKKQARANGDLSGAKKPDEAPETAGTRERGSDRRGSVRDHDSHVLVCKGGDCSKNGGKETRKRLKSELRAAGMAPDVRVDSVGCLGLCKQGPNVIVYPEGSWYLGLKERDVPEVVEEHLKGGEPVERLAAERTPRKKKAKG